MTRMQGVKPDKVVRLRSKEEHAQHKLLLGERQIQLYPRPRPRSGIAGERAG